MSREYDLKLFDKYGISKHRYRELKEFCLQYGEKKQEINLIYTLSAVPLRFKVMGGIIGNPTEKKALISQKLRKDIDIIDECIKESYGEDKGLVELLKKNVIDGIGYDKLGYVPCGQGQFYALRQHFFFILNKKHFEK